MTAKLSVGGMGLMESAVEIETQQAPSGLLTENQVAALLGITVGTLRKRRLFQRPPVNHKIGRSVRYARADVERFLAEQRVEPRRP